jgi:hypothetical protein
MWKQDAQRLVENYYRAKNALIDIGTTEHIPNELLQICLNASRETTKIIDYINEHKEELYKEPSEK